VIADRTAPRVDVGDAAPDFTLLDEAGREVRLADFAGRPLVLFFYPKDDTAGCTVEVCAFRDAYDEFVAAGAEVAGVSSDPVASHERFARRHGLPYRLLSDEGGALRARFGVPKTLGLLPGRVTYVIDGDGVVRHVFASQVQLRAHVREALATVREVVRRG